MREGWTYKKLGEVAFYSTSRVSSSSLDETNYVGVDNLLKDRKGKIDSTVVPVEGNCIGYKCGDILVGNIRPYLKKIWLANNDGGASGDVLVIRANNHQELHPDFLYWDLSNDAFFEYNMLHSKGAKMPRGNKVDILKYIVPVPPLSEQRSIVAELDKINELISLKKAQLSDLDSLAQSIFYDMFGDPTTNEKEWEVKTIEDICSSIVRGPFGSALKKEYFVEPDETTYKVYEQKHAIQKDASIGSYYVTKEKFDELSRFEIKANDIIMSCSGTIGELFRIPNSAEKGLMNQALLKFTLNESVDYHFFFFMMEYVKKDFTVRGTGLQNIGSVKIIKEMSFGLPPLSLQQDFAKRIELIEQQKAQISSTIKDLETLLASRMQYWFD